MSSRPNSLLQLGPPLKTKDMGYVPQYAIFPPHTPLGWFTSYSGKLAFGKRKSSLADDGITEKAKRMC